MRNIRLDLEYDGRNYCGWQWQPNVPSLEATVKKAIETMVGHEITPYSSGRTDAGVHAEQHVVHFFSDTPRTAPQLLRGLNSLLPNDIVVYRVLDMPPDWSARHDAYEREYRYTIYYDVLPSALWREHAYWFGQYLDVEAMQRAARDFEGRHDFSAFRSLHCDAENPVRKIMECRLDSEPPFLHLRVRGHAFLRHQIRTIAGTLLYIGLGKIAPDGIPAIIESKNRRLAGPTLPAQGLTLVAVRYPSDEKQFQGLRVYANGPVEMKGRPAL